MNLLGQTTQISTADTGSETKPKAACFNLMELFVKRELFQQLKRIPVSMAQYIQPGEIATFALNRLPPLYASSEQGKIHQMHRAQEFQDQVRTAVLQGIAGVLRDPLRKSTPLAITHRDICSDAYSIVITLERFVKKRGLISKHHRLNVQELETLVLQSLNQYDVAFAQLEDWLKQQELSQESLTAQNLVPVLKKAFHQLSKQNLVTPQGVLNPQILNERQAEFLSYDVGEVDDEPSDFASGNDDWYVD